ncbi:MAG: ATP-binding protein [Bacteroidales bacterium]|nr:ATP-binding protein [Bacteroidales bacterium]
MREEHVYPEGFGYLPVGRELLPVVGGWLIFGVAPTSLKIEGQNVSDNTQRKIAQALSLLEPQVDVTVEYIDIPDCWRKWQCDGIVAYRGICHAAISECERALSVCRNPVFHCHARPYSCHRVSTRGGVTGEDNPMLRNTLGAVVRGLKARITKFAHENDIPFAWQSRFYDRIIRNQEELNATAKYIEDNLKKWTDDENDDK